MKEGLIALNYECSKCNERMRLYERKSAVLDGDFEWVCSTITSQNIYGHTPMIILLTMRPSRLFAKIRCHAVASTRKRSAVRKMMNTEEKSNICDRLPYFNAPHSTPAVRIFYSFSGSHRNTYVLKPNSTEVVNTFCQHLQSTSVTLHKAGFV
ncbi:uncharacterized protein TNCV_4264821 [Trichonephila clavipes]|nr:uncharacterized protein TNCV_4264821 [Trichonephila clavipes]